MAPLLILFSLLATLPASACDSISCDDLKAAFASDLDRIDRVSFDSLPQAEKDKAFRLFERRYAAFDSARTMMLKPEEDAYHKAFLIVRDSKLTPQETLGGIKKIREAMEAFDKKHKALGNLEFEPVQKGEPAYNKLKQVLSLTKKRNAGIAAGLAAMAAATGAASAGERGPAQIQSSDFLPKRSPAFVGTVQAVDDVTLESAAGR